VSAKIIQFPKVKKGRAPAASPMTEVDRERYFHEGRVAVAMEALKRVLAWTERPVVTEVEAEDLLANIAQEADVALRLLVNLVTWRSGEGKPVRLLYTRTSIGIRLELMPLAPCMDGIDRVQVQRSFEALGEWAGLMLDSLPLGRDAGSKRATARQQDELLGRLRERVVVAMPGYVVEILSDEEE